MHFDDNCITVTDFLSHKVAGLLAAQDVPYTIARDYHKLVIFSHWDDSYILYPSQFRGRKEVLDHSQFYRIRCNHLILWGGVDNLLILQVPQ